MRFAFVSELIGAPWGGSELLWSQAAEELRLRGHEVFASVNHHPQLPEPIAVLAKNGVQIDRRLWRRSSFARRAWQRLTLRPVTHPGWEPSWQAVTRFRPDLVCVSNGGVFCGVEWMRRCREAGIPYVNIAQSNSEGEGSWPVDSQLAAVRAAFSSARRAFFVSHANLQMFERQIAMRLPNAEVIANPFGVNWEVDLPWPEENNGMRLACVARLEPHAKGQDILFKVLSTEKWRRRRLTVTLFGGGRHSQLVQDLIGFEGLQDCVRCAGHVPRVEDIWVNHHAMVLPSRYEGLPLAIVEAMLCGRLVITTDVSGNSEFLEDNVTGFIARTATTWDLDEAMERAWNARKKWKAMGRAAAESIRRQVPRNPGSVFADKLIELIEV